jgi:hypothetical protein
VDESVEKLSDGYEASEWTSMKTGSSNRQVSDPYRWMEEDTPALRTWVLAQHEYAMAQLSSLPANRRTSHYELF